MSKHAHADTVAGVLADVTDVLRRRLSARIPADEAAHIAAHEARVLLAWATGWSDVRIFTELQTQLDAPVLHRVRTAAEQRAAGTPLQYITGEAAFYGRIFAVQPGCLIPRPETEILADLAVRWVNAHHPSAYIWDLGCGSGILAATAALECPSANVFAMDVSAAAVHIAQGNFARLAAPVRLLHTDGLRQLEALRDDSQPLMHVLLSNPPYIRSADMIELDAEVAAHEPHIALDGGTDGLEFYRRMVAIGARMFAPTGPAALFWEVGMGQHTEVLALFAAARALWTGWVIRVEPDLRGVPRVIVGERL